MHGAKADFAVFYQDAPSAGSGQAGLWQLFRSSQGYLEISGYFGGVEYQPVVE